jgi:hypothetical protein
MPIKARDAAAVLALCTTAFLVFGVIAGLAALLAGSTRAVEIGTVVGGVAFVCNVGALCLVAAVHEEPHAPAASGARRAARAS